MCVCVCVCGWAESRLQELLARSEQLAAQNATLSEQVKALQAERGELSTEVTATGSELEQAVLSALYAAFDAKSDLADPHVQQALAETRPLSVLNREKITSLRRWAEDRCVSAD